MKIGLTGGIGCGKSTVVRFLRDLGWQTIESDEIVRNLLESDPEVVAEIQGRWGDFVCADGGQIARKELAKVVFSSEVELKWLESLLHPRVRAIWTRALASDPTSLWLVEIPLLYEKSLESEFDFVVCVESPERVVNQRMAERGYFDLEVNQRRQRQMPLSEKSRRAQIVLTNAGSIEFLEKQTQRLDFLIKNRSMDLS